MTPREVEVVRAYLQAGSVKGAARLLGIAEQTAKNHLQNARKHTGCRTLAELAVFVAVPMYP